MDYIFGILTNSGTINHRVKNSTGTDVDVMTINSSNVTLAVPLVFSTPSTITNGSSVLTLPTTSDTLATLSDLGGLVYSGSSFLTTSLTAGSFVDINISLGTISSKYNNGLPVIICQACNITNQVYINNFQVLGVSYQGWTSISNMGGSFPYKYAGFNFNIRVKNTSTSTTIPANVMNVSYLIYA